MNPRLAKLGSHLGNRILWFDGSMTIEPQDVLEYMTMNAKLHVTHITPDVKSYNLLADQPITEKTKLDINGIRPEEWNIPQRYKEMDLDAYFDEKLNEWEGPYRELRAARAKLELEAFREEDMEIVLRLMIFIVDTLESNNAVWGIGRGSSVSCFLLYLIGVHDIDSVQYQLNFSDFMKNS